VLVWYHVDGCKIVIVEREEQQQVAMIGKKAFMSAVLAVTLLTAVPSANYISARAAGADVTQQLGDKASVDWTTGTIKVTGSGAPPEKGSPAQKRLMAKRAAQVDGYRQLAEAIEGVHVDSETSVKDFVTESDVIKTRVQALVKGAVVVATRNMSDGSVEVDLCHRSARGTEKGLAPAGTESSARPCDRRLLGAGHRLPRPGNAAGHEPVGPG